MSHRPGEKSNDPARERLIASKIATIVDNAVVEVVNNLLTLVGPNKASIKEITHVMRSYSDFAEGWQEALNGDYNDNGEFIELIETAESSVPQDRLSMARSYEQGVLFNYVDPNKETSND